MNLFTSALRLFGLGKLANPETGQQHSGPATHGTEAGIVVSDERALQVSAVWSCVRLIAETVGSLPLGFYRTEADGSRGQLDRTHPIVELFGRRPNGLMNPQEFREAMTCQLVLWGNAYARIDWIGERPVAITPLRPEYMTPMRMNGEITYHYATDKGPTVFAKRSILHLKGFGTDGVIGLSPLAYARNTLGITVSADKYASASFANGGRPGGVLTVDRFLDAKQRDLVKELYSNISRTADNAGNLWVLEGGMQYKEITMPPDDMQMLQTRQFQLGEIARIFRVPSHLINDTEKSTSWGSGIEQQNLGFLAYTLRPYLTRWEAVIRDSLLNPVERDTVVVEHNVEGLLRADSAARANFYASMSQNGLMTRNEIRRKENLPALAGGDELTAQTNLAPLDELGNTQPAAAAPVKQEPPVINVSVTPAPITVNTAPVQVRTEPHIEVHGGKRGDVEREVIETNEYGVPTKVIEREIRRGET